MNPYFKRSPDTNRPLTPIEHEDPIAVFSDWLTTALNHEQDANAFTLCTYDEDTGFPNARILLLKMIQEDPLYPLMFFSNAMSQKAKELKSHAKAAMVFHWKSLAWQVRVQGTVALLDKQLANDYFATRSKDSQMATTVSRQSQPLESRNALLEAHKQYAFNLGDGKVPAPEHWLAYGMQPSRMEFWQEMPHRLHHRVVFEKGAKGWSHYLLYP